MSSTTMTFAAYIPTCTSCFVNGARSSTRATVTSAGDPQAPKLSPQEMQSLQGGGIVILICLAGLTFLHIIDRR
jgi:hypothetical protein